MFRFESSAKSMTSSVTELLRKMLLLTLIFSYESHDWPTIPNSAVLLMKRHPEMFPTANDRCTAEKLPAELFMKTESATELSPA